MNEQLKEICDELNLTTAQKNQLDFISYDDPSFIESFIIGYKDKNELEKMLEALHYDIRYYKLNVYTHFVDTGEYEKIHRSKTVMERYLQEYEPKEESKIRYDEYDKYFNIKVEGDIPFQFVFDWTDEMLQNAIPAGALNIVDEENDE